MATATLPPNDCPVCGVIWDRTDHPGDELTKARVFHLAAYHPLAELLDVLDTFTATAAGPAGTRGLAGLRAELRTTAEREGTFLRRQVTRDDRDGD